MDNTTPSSAAQEPAWVGKPTIYLIDYDNYYYKLDQAKLAKEIYRILNLNGLGDSYYVKFISKEEMMQMNKDKALQTYDAILSLRTIEDPASGLNGLDGNTVLQEGFDNSPDPTNSFVNPWVVQEKRVAYLANRQIKVELETMVAAVILHEVSHQYVNRLYRYYKGVETGNPDFMDAWGHINGSSNLMIDGSRPWRAESATSTENLQAFFKMTTPTARYWKVFAYCVRMGCAPTTDSRIWSKHVRHYLNNIEGK